MAVKIPTQHDIYATSGEVDADTNAWPGAKTAPETGTGTGSGLGHRCNLSKTQVGDKGVGWPSSLCMRIFLPTPSAPHISATGTIMVLCLHHLKLAWCPQPWLMLRKSHVKLLPQNGLTPVNTQEVHCYNSRSRVLLQSWHVGLAKRQYGCTWI